MLRINMDQVLGSSGASHAEPQWNCRLRTLILTVTKFPPILGFVGRSHGDPLTMWNMWNICLCPKKRVSLHRCLASCFQVFPYSPMNIDFSWQLASISEPWLKIAPSNICPFWSHPNNKPLQILADPGLPIQDKSCMSSVSEPHCASETVDSACRIFPMSN